MLNKNVEQKKLDADNLTVGARGGAVAFGLKIASAFLNLANQVMLARMLGAGGVGGVILALSVVRVSIQVAKFGMEEAMMRFIPLYVETNDRDRLKGSIYFALAFCLLISIVLMLMVLVFSRFISVNIFHSEGLLRLLPVAAIAIPFCVTRDVIGGILRGYKDVFKSLIPESFISPFFRLAVFLFLSLKGVSAYYAIVAFVVGEVLAFILSIVFLIQRINRIGHVRKKCDRKKILDVAFSIIFTSMTILLYTQADIWILGMYTSTDIVGIYGTAAKLMIVVYFPMLAFFNILPPIISSVYTSGDLVELRTIVSNSTRWILSMAMPIILILLFEGRLILKYAFGEEFMAGYIVLVILTLGQMIKAAAGLVGTLFQMTGEHKVYMKVNVFWGILNIIMNIILVPRYGMAGAAVATAFCLSMIDIICIVIAYKRLSVLTLASGLKFDLVFITVVAAAYFLLAQNNYYTGHHILLALALTVYIGKSIYNNDIPLKLLFGKHIKS